MTLFQTGDFTLSSGAKSNWKIECDALTPDDWAGLAAIASARVPPFGYVTGVPRGGLLFAAAMEKYRTEGLGTWLICEDVVTTGGSMERFKKVLGTEPVSAGQEVIGVVAFARGPVPAWVVPLFTLTAEQPRPLPPTRRPTGSSGFARK
jgi:orotate phosphoribosyltransferase